MGQERKTSNVRNARNVRTGNYNRKGSSCELVRAHCRSRSSQRLELCNKVHSNTTAYWEDHPGVVRRCAHILAESTLFSAEQYGVQQDLIQAGTEYWEDHPGDYTGLISRFMLITGKKNTELSLPGNYTHYSVAPCKSY